MACHNLIRTAQWTLLFSFLSCTKTCAKPPLSIANEKAVEKPTIQVYSNFAELDLSGLDDEKRKAFIRILNDEICPCDCPKTWAACLQAQSLCKPAVILAQWMLRVFQQDATADLIAQRVAAEIGEGFNSAQQSIRSDNCHAKPQDSKVPIIITEFADFQCSACKLVSKSLAELSAKYPEQVRIQFKHYPLVQHSMAKEAAIASEAAGKQGKFWQMHDLLFATQSLSSEIILGHAHNLGLNIEKFKADLRDPKIQALVDEHIEEGNALKISGTPAVYFNQRSYNLTLNLDGLETRLNMEMARSTNQCK